MRRSVATLALGVLTLSGACAEPAVVDLRGEQIEVLAVWSGTEQQRFEDVLGAFEARTGATVTYTSAGHGVPAALTARLADGRPPDVAFLPQPGLLRRFASEGVLVPLDAIAGDLVAAHYPQRWRQLGSVDGRLYGVWFKAANKSLIWYDVSVFEQHGIVPPADLDGLLAVARFFAATGVPAFSVGGADGWTLTDWFENLYLRVAGPARYDLLAEHRLPWTDESVKDTLRLLARLLAPDALAGGTEAALETGFVASVEQMFQSPPAAAMVFEGDFVAGLITGRAHARLGVAADVFAFPGRTRTEPMVVGGGDAAVLMRPSPAGAELLRFLASPDAAAIWARQGGFISPNVDLDLSAYPDDISRSLARNVLEAGDDFRFDLSDLQPAAFGGVADRGLRKGLQDFLRTRDVEQTAAVLEAEAAAAYAT